MTDKPFISIITPSLMRPSLADCCRSVDDQTFENWQHVIMLDLPDSLLDWEFLSTLLSPRRLIYTCGKRYGHYGNHARHAAWTYCNGDYLLGLDDDNRMYHPDALADIVRSLEEANWPPFALFPIHRHGSVFLCDPPGICRTDTANVVVRRELGRWPDIESREADGHWVENLRVQYPYVTFPAVKPIVLMEKSSNGE